ncbi:hypothetical protein AtDm6_2251 [Acetobacter tropicalis]|uniref:Uncharacterized protein n=1 Tax=Acetobacter tropicalis TaxID=104102 RepID=A0A094YKV6_9PROT|nr:hypothetical protein AtDm6_2251 [Acetobacter tropicalis]
MSPGLFVFVGVSEEIRCHVLQGICCKFSNQMPWAKSPIETLLVESASDRTGKRFSALP